MRLGDREVGPGHPVLVCAEIGINHNGSVDTALEMVRAAAAAGADAVKVQHFEAEGFCTPDVTWKGERQLDMFQRYELSYGNLADIAEQCRACGVIFFGTPDSVEHGHELIALGAPMLKVGSDDLTNLSLLRGLAALGVPMILSTGMATEEEIDDALDTLSSRGPLPKWVTLLHCVSLYPTPIECVNFGRLRWMLDTYSCPIGYSDHTGSLEVSPLAAQLGASIVEVHVTLDRCADGPDHAFSLEPSMLAIIVNRIRRAEQGRKRPVSNPGPEELEMRKQMRRSVTAKRAIRRHSVITADALCYKRPGTGLPPADADRILGRVAQRDIAADEQLREGDWV